MGGGRVASDNPTHPHAVIDWVGSPRTRLSTRRNRRRVTKVGPSPLADGLDIIDCWGFAMGCSWREQEARNEAGARDRNEWILREDERYAGPLTVHTFVCECGDASCQEPIKLTTGEYEAVRDYATRFALALNHQNPEAEYLVSETADYAVVEKIDEPYRRIVRASDPRR